MSSKRKNMLHCKFTKTDGQLKPNTPQKYKMFLDSMEEGDIADVFLEFSEDDGTLAQLAKIHACIRELAKETGDTYADMKLTIKRECGLCVKKEFEGEMYMICRSFGDASLEELSLAIQAIITAGEMVGINFN